MWGDNEFSQLGLEAKYLLVPEPLPLKSIVKISAAHNYSAALDSTGNVFVWGENHYSQFGSTEDIFKKPTKIASGCIDIEAGEGALALIYNDHIKLSGFKIYKEFQTVELPTKIVTISVGDLYAAYNDVHGEVYSLGGLFTKKSRSSFFIKPPKLQFERVSFDFFPGKVKYLKGKYSYHTAIIDI